MPDIYIITSNVEYSYFSINNIVFKKLVFKLEFFQYYLQFVNSKLWFFEYLLINKYVLKNNKPILELGFVLIILSIFIKLSFPIPFMVFRNL